MNTVYIQGFFSCILYTDTVFIYLPKFDSSEVYTILINSNNSRFCFSANRFLDLYGVFEIKSPFVNR